MKHVAAGAHLPTPWLLSLRNDQTIEPTTAQYIGCVIYWLRRVRFTLSFFHLDLDLFGKP